jgi:hypothetical protein
MNRLLVLQVLVSVRVDSERDYGDVRAFSHVTSLR